MRILIKQLSKYKQSGFTLAEGMVTAGLLGIVSLAMLQGLKQDTSTKQLIRLEDEIHGVMKTINSSMKDTASCTNTFGEGSPNGALQISSTSDVEIDNLYDGAGDNLWYRLPSTGTNLSIKTGMVLSGVSGDSNLYIERMAIQNFKEFFRFEENFGQGGGAGVAEAIYGMGEFVVTFMRTAGVGDNARRVSISRSINLTLKGVESGGQIRIVGCANQSDITTLQLKQRVCAQMVRVGGGGEVMVGSYNPQTGACGGIIQGLNETATDLICAEMGGYLTPDGTGKFKCAVFPPGIPNCFGGFRTFGNDGRPSCI